jgi:hypothetical protein
VTAGKRRRGIAEHREAEDNELRKKMTNDKRKKEMGRVGGEGCV